MGCGCGGGGGGSQIAAQRTSFRSNFKAEDPGPCDYTHDIIQSYDDKLVWARNRGRYLKAGLTARLLNKYRGLTLTTLHIKNVCTYKKEMDELSPYILLITELQNEPGS